MLSLMQLQQQSTYMRVVILEWIFDFLSHKGGNIILNTSKHGNLCMEYNTRYINSYNTTILFIVSAGKNGARS